MHAVCETHAFRNAAERAGMSEDEISDLVLAIAANPMIGDQIAGTGGCRKVRVAGRGKGKSGGYRTITFFTGENMPVFLITVFSKGDRANLSMKERNQLGAITKLIADQYRARPFRGESTKGSSR